LQCGEAEKFCRRGNTHYIGVMHFTKGFFLTTAAVLIFGSSARPATLDYQSVIQRADQWQPKASEKIFDQIGWGEDIRAGLRRPKNMAGRCFCLPTMDE
jgi:hypothetical protein